MIKNDAAPHLPKAPPTFSIKGEPVKQKRFSPSDKAPPPASGLASRSGLVASDWIRSQVNHVALASRQRIQRK